MKTVASTAEINRAERLQIAAELIATLEAKLQYWKGIDPKNISPELLDKQGYARFEGSLYKDLMIARYQARLSYWQYFRDHS